MLVRRIFFITYCIMLFQVTSCTKENETSSAGIPYVPVNERININDPIYVNLQNVGGWAYMSGGSRGIILYRESVGSIIAYDRHCTFDPEQVCSTVDMEAGLLQANDYDCCGSVFSIGSNSIIKGPANRPLLKYDTQFDGTFLTVTN